MNKKHLMTSCAIATFTFSTTLSGSLVIFGQKKPNYFNIVIPTSIARLAFGLGMLGTGITMILASWIEAVETEDLDFKKPRPVPTPCLFCRYYHGSSYGGVFLNCAIHPDGYFSDKCPDWEAHQLSHLE